jgi:hypothetical protein
MEHLHLGVGGGRDDGEAADDLTLLGAPALPDPAQGEGRAIPAGDGVGLFAGADLVPLVEALGGDEAATSPECAPEQAGGRDGLGPCVDRPQRALQLFCKVREQSSA